MTKIKICGIRTKEDVDILNEVKPEYAGFVLAESKRRVPIEEVQKLIEILNTSIIPVGVFVNETHDNLMAAFEAGIKIFQLHGDEDQEYVNVLCQKFHEMKVKNNISIWKAFRVPYVEQLTNNTTSTPEHHNIETIINQYNDSIDAVVLDKYSKEYYGGTGEKFDWNIFSGFTSKKPLILAGGLNESNVLEGIKIVTPYCVDVSSGVEIHGKKNRELIEGFVNKVRNHNFKGE